MKEKLEAKGHTAEIGDVVPEGEVHPGKKDISFSSNPNVETYDAVIFGSPVQAFSLAAAMKAYMAQMGSLKDKKIAVYVTKQLPGKWTGGNKAVKQMSNFSGARGGTVIGTNILNWSKQDNEENIEETAEEVSKLF